MPTVALGNTNQTTGMCMSTPTCTPTIGSAISKPDQIESMHTDIASNVAHSVKEKIYGSEYIDLSVLLLTNPAAKQGTQKLSVQGGSLVIQTETVASSKINSIEQWTTAFISL